MACSKESDEIEPEHSGQHRRARNWAFVKEHELSYSNLGSLGHNIRASLLS